MSNENIQKTITTTNYQIKNHKAIIAYNYNDDNRD